MALRIIVLSVCVLLLIGGTVWGQEETPPVEAPLETAVPAEIPTATPTEPAASTPTEIPTEITPEITDEPAPEVTVEVTDEIPAVETTDVPTATSTPDADGLVTIEAEDALVVQTGVWTAATNESASGGALLLSSGSTGDILTLGFSGTAVAVVYAQSPILGSFALEVDGMVVQVVSANGQDASTATVSLTGLAEGEHTLRVVSTGGIIAIDTLTAAAFGSVVVQPTAEATPEIAPEVTVDAAQQPQLLGTTMFVVNTVADNGPGSLRQAIEDANANAGKDTITFNIPDCLGVCTIQPTSALPAIFEAVVIDGFSQPGSGPGTLLIELNGQSALSNGLNLAAGASTVKGLVINRFAANGILIQSDASGSRIESNYIGTDAAGNVDLGNSESGVRQTGAASVRYIRNVISGNGAHGIQIEGAAAANNVINGNILGLNAAGTAALGNSASGISITDSSGTTIGGSSASQRNLISANGANGVVITNISATNNVIQGNYIGTDVTGLIDLGNQNAGILITASSSGNRIGGTGSGQRNLISGNNGVGVGLMGGMSTTVQGNYIGVDRTGTVALGNGGDGVAISNANNVIGGTTASARNIISGNGGNGLMIVGVTGTLVRGNYIGTNAAGDAAIPNALSGVLLENAADNAIGGTASGSRNVISGNTQHGVQLLGTGSINNLIAGNYIGTNKNGNAALGNGLDGITVTSSENRIGGTSPTARNVISGNGGNGVSLMNASATLVQGNYIGTNAAGTAALPNAESGVSVDNSGSNTIGGFVSGGRNIISGNSGNGIFLLGAGSTENLIQNNYIGTTAAGNKALGNGANGIYLQDAPANVIGSPGGARRNVIAANGLNGIWLLNSSSNGILNTYIGTTANGSGDLGNQQNGILISDGSTENLIGGPETGWRVVSAGNGGDGILLENASTNVIANVYIGLASDGSKALGNDGNGVTLADAAFNVIGPLSETGLNRIAYNTIGIAVSGFGSAENLFIANRIFRNRDLGIDLGLDGPTANDSGDGDSGPNGLLNFPVITNVASDSITVTLDTNLANTNVTFDFYRQAACDPSGFGEGEIWIAQLVGVTDGSGDFTGTLTGLSPKLAAGAVITTTASLEGTVNGTTSEFSACVPFVTSKPAVPALSSPANNGHTNDNTPLLTWKPAKGAETYCVQLAADAQFANLLADVCDLPQQFFAPAALADGLYFWRVRGVNEVGQSSFSAARRFTVDTVAPTTAPELTSPANGGFTSDTTPSFKWKAFPNAAHYQLQLSTSVNCAAPFYVSPVLTKTGFTLPNASKLTAEDTYYWCVRADDLAGNWGPYSASFQFGLTLLSSPKDGAVIKDSTPTFSWKAAPGSGVRYRLVINDTPDFNTPVFERSDLNRTSFTLPDASALTHDHVFFWTVQVTGGTWTTAEPIFWSFMLLTGNSPAPGLDAPANGERTSETTPTLSWFAVPPIGTLGISYTVQVDNNSDFSSPVFTQSGLTALNVTLSPALPASPGTKYYWRVRAHYCASGPTCSDAIGPYSAARNFTLDTEPPLNFNLTAPANTAQVVDNPPTLRWQASNGAVEYLVRLDTNNPPTTPLALVPGSTTQYTPGTTFAPATYFWQVIARDAAANEFPSQVFSFTIGEIADDTDTNIFVGEGYTDVSPKQVVRTTSNMLYTVLIDCANYPSCLGNSLRVYKGNQAGVPTSFQRMDQADEPQNALVAAAAIDGNNNIHIVYVQRSDQTNASRLDYVIFNTNTNSFGSVQTIDNALNFAGGGQGDQAAAVALDANGVPHVVYTKSDGTRRQVYYRNRIGGSWSAATHVDQGVSYGANQRAWHPNLAFDTQGRVVVAWMRGSFNAANDGTIFSRVRNTNGTWASIATISSNNGARVHIDQSTSLLITANNRYHITYISSPNDYIRYAYSDDHGATWTHNNPGGGTQATHNPSLGFGPGGTIRIYGHGTPVPAPDGHGMNLYYYQGSGGGSGWGGWTQIIAGAYDSSVNTRWSQYFYYHPNYLDFVYWADPYPNLAYAASIVWN